MSSQRTEAEIAVRGSQLTGGRIKAVAGDTHTQEAKDPSPIGLGKSAAKHRAEDGAALGTREEDGHGERSSFHLGSLKCC